MGSASVLFFSPQTARRFAAELAARDAEPQLAPAPHVEPPPDPRAWERAVSELALFNWLLLPTACAAEALIESVGAVPGRTLRIAAVGAAADVLRTEGRAPEIEAPGLRKAIEAMSGRLGRRQRVLVAHAAVAGRASGRRLEALGAEVVCRAAYDLAVPNPSLGAAEPAAAAVANAPEAEALACYIRASRVAAGIPIAALEQGAADAGEDCGLAASLVPASRFGPFLDEALS